MAKAGQKNKAPDDPQAVEQRAVFLLGRRDHSEAELRRKLLDKGFAADPIEEVLEALKEREWLSDERFAASYIRQRIDSGYGPLKIYADMSQKGIPRSMVDQLLEELEVDWVAVAADRYRRRFGQSPPDSDKEKARRQRHLAARGFFSSDVFAAIEKALDAAN